jgi:uncharacterized protein (TIGR02722 family)
MGLDYRDFRQAANELTQSLIQSGRLSKKTGGRYVMATGRVINDTMQRIDTNQLMVEIEDSLTNSGLVAMTAAVGHGGNRDDMIYETRELRKSGEFNQSTVAGEGQLIAPELSIHGKITQRDIKYSGSKTQVEYMFRLYVKDLSSGMVFWQKQVPIIKRGSSKSVSW